MNSRSVLPLGTRLTQPITREEKIKVLRFIQDLGFVTPTSSAIPIHELDQVYQLTERWKNLLEKKGGKEQKGKIIYLNFRKRSRT